MPGIETVANALLQIVTIGIGSPLGKEGAPRMVGALVANRVGNWFRLDHEDTRLLMAACARWRLCRDIQYPGRRGTVRT